jgi:membrane protease YdiL (CAAX protease family)
VRETLIVIVTSAVLLVDWYHAFVPLEDLALGRGLQRALLYLAVPLLVLLALGERPRDYGLRIGHWRAGMAAAGLAALVATPVILVAAGWPEYQAYYGRDPLDLPRLVIANALDVGSAEFLFRGFLMMALFRWVGPLGVVLATFPFVFMHLGKPELETLSTVFGGIGFGWLAWRTRSVLYGAALHLYILSLVVVATSL